MTLLTLRAWIQNLAKEVSAIFSVYLFVGLFQVLPLPTDLLWNTYTWLKSKGMAHLNMKALLYELLENSVNLSFFLLSLSKKKKLWKSNDHPTPPKKLNQTKKPHQPKPPNFSSTFWLTAIWNYVLNISFQRKFQNASNISLFSKLIKCCNPWKIWYEINL